MRIFFLLAAFLSAQCSYGQWFNNITTYSTQNGLSNNTITCLQKDEAGFLWIGTHEGLNRYDGTAFVNVLSNPQNNLPSNNINKISFINKNTLAVATEAGLCFLNPVTLTGRLIPLPYNKKFTNTGFGIEELLYRKEQHEVWVATWQGLFILDEEGRLKKQLMSPEADILKGRFARNFVPDKNGQVYFYSQQTNRFYYPDFERQQLLLPGAASAAFELNDLLLADYRLRSVVVSGHVSACIFSKFGRAADELLLYNNSAGGKYFNHRITVDFADEKQLCNAFPLNDSVFIINSYFGEPMIYNSHTKKLMPAADHPLWFTSWPDGYATEVCPDGNNLWIATSKALLRSSLKTNLFTSNASLTALIGSKKSLVSYNHAIYNNNKLWMACMGAGLFGLDTLHNTIRDVFSRNTFYPFTKKLVSTKVIPAGRLLWLFSVYGPVAIDPVSSKLQPVSGINKVTAFDDAAGYPFADAKGNIWTTLPNGTSSYNIANNTFTNHTSKYEGGDFPLLRAGPKAADAAGNIWMARQDTLVRYDAAKKTFSISLISKNGKPVRPVTGLESDGGDVLYMAVGGAFGIYHISTQSIELFTKQTGIISTAINSIASDAAGNAWLGTEGGLVFYNRQKMKFSSFTKADGLPDDNIIGANFTDDTKKELFLGFAKTYCLFRPEYFLLQKTVPQNVITGADIEDRSVIGQNNPTLSYRQNSISFSYTGINFNQGHQNNYACMLEGFDKDWKYTGAERKINYINLPPGDYTFKVKAANHQGEWNEQPAVFSFRIRPPFWQQWWFRILMTGIVIFGIYYFIKRRDAALQKENALKLQMSELQMQALRAQMNPHFIFNSLNSIQNYILSNNTMDAAGYLSKFAKLIRRILDQSKHAFLPLGEVMETLKMYVEIEAFRFNNKFSYTFNVEENDDLLDARIPPMLLQPFVENAILHGLMPKKGDKKLRVDCSIADQHIEIMIDDNGIGRTMHAAKAGHDSQGEKLTAGMLESLQQIQHIKASLHIIDKKDAGAPAGTTVKLLIALK